MDAKRALAPLLGIVALGLVSVSPVTGSAADQGAGDAAARAATTTPIKHLVVIFQENVSFDHYFGTYPHAANPAGEPRFVARDDTPSVNGLTPALLNANPNRGNPQRLDRTQALTCDQDHDYTAEQKAYDGGVMDKFVQFTGNSLTLGECLVPKQPATPGNYAVMDYYDGNTVTALWNYAQGFAMSDNSFGTGFGPSTPGAFEVVAGNTFGATCGADFDPNGVKQQGTPCTGWPAAAGPAVAQGPGTVISDPDPLFDACASPTRGKAAMGGSNVGDLLNARGLTWGWFQGGFKPTSRTASGAPVCGSSHYNIGAGLQNDGQPCVRHTPAQPIDAFCQTDYNPHHQPFEYWPQTANPQHLPPTSVAAVGHQDQANHQYDLGDFWAAAGSGHMPDVSYLKAPNYQDGHAGYSDPLDEQTFLVSTINRLQRLPTWQSTAVVILYDDSDGWYDHQMGPIFNQSQTPLDALTGAGQCGSNPARVPSGQQARCGFGPRQPLLVVSPWARQNSVDHSLTDQSSVIGFIEDNWKLGRLGGGSFDASAGTLKHLFDFGDGPRAGRLILDPATGQPTGRDD
jgi:phospholipase C